MHCVLRTDCEEKFGLINGKIAARRNRIKKKWS